MRLERERRDVAALLVGHAVQLDGDVAARARRSSAASPTSTPPFMSATPGPSARSPSTRTGRAAAVPGREHRVVVAEQQDAPPARAVRARDDVQTDGRGQQVDGAAGRVGPLRDQRGAGVEPVAVHRSGESIAHSWRRRSR